MIQKRYLRREALLLDFAETLVELMERYAVEPEELADRVGMSLSRLNSILGCQRGVNLCTVADLFGELGCRATVRPLV